MESVAEHREVVAKMTDLRGSPGVLVLSAACTVRYMNRQARELLRDMNDGSVPGAASGELPTVIHEVCRELYAIDGGLLHPMNREQVEVRRLAKGQSLHTIVRGLLVPGIGQGDLSGPP